MCQHHRGIIPGIALALALSAAGSESPRVMASRQDPPAAPQVATIPIEVVALDRDGKVVDTLGPDSFVVAVDGKPRRVLWARYVSRGPGSSGEAIRRQVNRSDTLRFAAEPARNILVVVDETSIQRGAERTVLQAAGALIDRFGLDDRIGVIRIPVMRDNRVALTTERPELREALRQVVGRAAQASASPADEPLARQQQAQAADPNRAVTDPVQTTGGERERPPTAAAPDTGRPADEGLAPLLGVVDSLQGLLKALQPSPGRKAIVLFSGGLPPAESSRLDDVALQAAAAHTVIYAFGLQGLHGDAPSAPDLAALERLAKATGGSYGALGRNADRSVERVVPELAACYVLGIESAPSDADGRRHALRVETPRQSLTLRAPAWLVSRADIEDLVPPTPGQAADPEAPAYPRAGLWLPASSARTVAGAERDAELQRVIARAADYVAGYQREYSLLVAEENYVQSSRTERQQMRSDLLLVRPPGVDSWVSFRDVYEVNAVPVRDRDDRLKRLFLDPSAEARNQLMAIKEESARYNIGQVERNINVPLFALKFLEYENLLRFEFKLGGKQDVAGVEAARIDYDEWARPTVTQYNREFDLPARGWFLVDPVSGAVVGSRMELVFDSGRGLIEFEVRY